MAFGRKAKIQTDAAVGTSAVITPTVSGIISRNTLEEALDRTVL
jgi:hypothetical protein